MMNLTLRIQPHTERKLKQILASIQDEEVFAQNIIDYQVKELHRGIMNLRLDMQQFEDEHNDVVRRILSKV